MYRSRYLGRKDSGWKDKWETPTKLPTKRPKKYNKWEEIKQLGGWDRRGQISNVLHPGMNTVIGKDRVPILDSIKCQAKESRELSREGHDERGLSRKERVVWKLFLHGFCLMLAFSAHGLEVIEPKVDSGGTPLNTTIGSNNNKLYTCMVWENGHPQGQYIKPTSPAGGGKININLPPTLQNWCWEVACANAPYGKLVWGAPLKFCLDVKEIP